MHTFSQEAITRPLRTIQAAALIRTHAWTISRATANAKENELIVVTVHHDLTFGGIWTLARADFVNQCTLVEDEHGWSITFSPHTSISGILERCHTLSAQASRRHELLARHTNR